MEVNMEVFDIIDDLAIEEENIFHEYLNPPSRKPRSVRPRPNHVFEWDEKEFCKRFRLPKDTVQYLLSLIEDQIAHQTDRNQCVPPMQQLLLTLRFYATGSSYITIGDFGGLHNSTLCQIIKRVTAAIASLRPNFVNLPHNHEEILLMQQDFYQIARFPRVIAALDGTHIKIKSPGGNTAEIFRNRKSFFSLNVQAMVTANLKFIDIVTRWPGSTHDSTIFSNSFAKHQFDNGIFENGIILGDSGYHLNNYLLTPILDPQTEIEQLYNESQIRMRNVIERCFGVWKRRFPVLSLGLRCKISLAQDIIVATAILHNLALIQNEGEPPVDPEVAIPSQPVFPTEPVDEADSSTRDIILVYFESLLNVNT